MAAEPGLARAAEVPRPRRRAELKLQRWEWLVRPDGALVKADALDHHADHGLVGCQDALWDVAGAAVELGLSRDEETALARAVREASPGAPPSSLPFYRAAYAAYEVARWTLAAGDPGLDRAEAARRRQEADRLTRALRAPLAGEDARGGAHGSEPWGPHDRPG